MQWTFSVTLCALLASACSKGDNTIDIVFDPCEPVALAPVAGTSADELETIDAGVALWEAVAAVDISRDPASLAESVIPIAFDDAPTAFRGVYDDEVGVVTVNRRLGPADRAITLAHELGHAFGLVHVEGVDSVMNPGNITVEPLPADTERLSELWGPCVFQAR